MTHRVFLAGASGVIGIRVLPLLVQAGHTVAAMTRREAMTAALRALGGEPVVCDVYDAERLTAAVVAFAPDVMMHQLTDLPDDASRVLEFAQATSRIRREGTRNLVAAARAVGARRFLAQSVAWTLPAEGSAAQQDLERMVLQAGGVVLRYGRLYGPGTYYEAETPEPPRIHVDQAARRTVELLEAASGVFTIAQDD